MCSWQAILLLLAVLLAAPVGVCLLARHPSKYAAGLIGNHAVGIPLALLVLFVFAFVSLRCGALEIGNQTAWNAIFSYDSSDFRQTIVRELRLQRTIIGIVAGMSLAVSGVLIQGVTRNPLGSPGILGINAGAAFAIVTAIFLVGLDTPLQYIWFAFAGALGAAVLVYLIGSAGRSGATPVKLALSGIIITTLFGSWTTALLLLDQETLDEARFWLAGSISGRGTEEIMFLFPVVIAALLAGILMGRQVNVMALGEEVASGLGQRTALVRIAAGACVVVLAGSAVAIAGPIAFVGLAIPHMVRSLVGPDYRWILLYSAILGPCLLLGADIVGRIALRPQELPVGVVTAAVGVPILLWLVRFSRLSKL